MAEAGPLDPDGGGKLLALDWRPPDRVVRQFGLICAVLLPAMAWWWLGRPGWAAEWSPRATLWVGRFAALGALLAALGLVRPAWLRPAFVGLCVLAYPLGLILSGVLLRLVYYGVFTPMAWWFRRRGRDALRQRPDPAAPSYWEPRCPNTPAPQYFRMF